MYPGKYTVYKEMEFAAAHFLREYHGKCEKLHGHNYTVRVYASADELDAEGMVVDFAILKSAMKEVVGRLDHALLNDVEPFDSEPPSAELIARQIAEQVAGRVDDGRVKVVECRVWETARSCAIYRRD